ncbi:MAG: preprotein translocase subunit SecE [Pseudomonadota bacterium]|jgi:preprotein translocase subunit SecE
MDKTNQKILTLSFVIFSVIISVSTSLLLKALAGSFGVVARMHDVDLVKHGLPVAIGLVLFASLQFNKNVLAWGEDVALEIRKVVWPSRKDTTAMTIAVVVMVLISTVIITFFDVVSGNFVNFILR